MYSKVLVTLDGSGLAEVALPYAEQMALAFDSELVLFQAIPRPQGIYDEERRPLVSEDAVLASATGAAIDYLTGVCVALTKKGVKCVRQEVRIGDPAEQIIDYAREMEAGIIAMATHGRSGISRWVYGSVADKVLRGASTPVLLIRAGTLKAQ